METETLTSDTRMADAMKAGQTEETGTEKKSE